MKSTLIDSIPDAQTRARFEFRCEKQGHEGWLVTYDLVLPLNEVDCRGTFDHEPAKKRPKNYKMRFLRADNCFCFPLGSCLVGTTNAKYPFNVFDGSIDLPFRDGVHCGWDSQKMPGLAIYYIAPNGTYLLEKDAATLAAHEGKK